MGIFGKQGTSYLADCSDSVRPASEYADVVKLVDCSNIQEYFSKL